MPRNNGLMPTPYPFSICKINLLLPHQCVVLTLILNPAQVATANTYAQLFSNLPSCGKPTRVMMYDLHTLQVSSLCYDIIIYSQFIVSDPKNIPNTPDSHQSLQNRFYLHGEHRQSKILALLCSISNTLLFLLR